MIEHSVLGRDIFIIDKYFKLYLKRELKKFDLNTSEAMVLLALYGKGSEMGENVFDEIHEGKLSKTQEQIIHDLHYDKAAMTRIMRSLEEKELVYRKENQADSRSFLFAATKKADAFKPELIAVLKRWNDTLLKGIENPDLIKIVTGKMAENAKNSI